MKKFICALLCLIIVFSMAGCEKKMTEPEGSLLYDLQINRDEIDYILFADDQLADIKITDAEDVAYLCSYTYEGPFPEERLHEVYLKPAARTLTICYGGENRVQITLLKDGNIVTSSKVETAEGTFDAPDKVYTASDSEMINREVLQELFEKYGGYFDENIG